MKNMSFKENTKVAPMIVQHWENKFQKAIQVLIKSGYSPEQLIEKLKEISGASISNE